LSVYGGASKVGGGSWATFSKEQQTQIQEQKAENDELKKKGGFTGTDGS